MGPLKGDDPFRFADAIQGEGKMMISSINGCKSDAELQRLISTAGESAGNLTLEQAKADLGGMRQIYDRAARAFANPDPNAAVAELQRLEQQAGSGRTGALSKIFMPSLLSAYKSKLKGAQELALLVAKLQKIAEGKEKPAELRNAALLLARASAGARSVPDDAQDSIELMRVAHTALQDADAARAAAPATMPSASTAMAPKAPASRSTTPAIPPSRTIRFDAAPITVSGTSSGRSRSSRRLAANWRTDWQRGPSLPSMFSGRPITRPPIFRSSIKPSSALASAASRTHSRS
jgi:hypothetical protein